MIKVNKAKKVGDKINVQDGWTTKEMTIKKVVINEEFNRYEYFVSKTKSVLYPIREEVRTRKIGSRLIGFYGDEK